MKIVRVFGRYDRGQTNTHIHRHTDTLSTILFSSERVVACCSSVQFMCSEQTFKVRQFLVIMPYPFYTPEALFHGIIVTPGCIVYDTIRYGARCCFNVRSKADISLLIPHGINNKKWGKN